MVNEKKYSVDPSGLLYRFIYARLDYYSAVFNDVTIDYVLNDFLKLGIEVQNEFVQEVNERAIGFNHYFEWAFQNIRVRVRHEAVSTADDIYCTNIFLKKYTWIQLDISGQGLDYLRSRDFDCDSELRKLPLMYGDDPEHMKPLWHVTRADFAFDFINYAGDFLDKCMDWVIPCCQKSIRPRISTCGSGGQLTVSPRPAEHTLYLGSTRSDAMLRIYDKKIETEKRGAALDAYQKFGVENIESWIRIEWQTRDKVAHQYLYSESDWLSILKEIYRRYSFYDAENKGPADFWIRLYNWDVISNIIQNANWTEPVITKDGLISKVTNNPDVWAVIAHMGVVTFLRCVQQAMTISAEFESRSAAYKYKKFERDMRILQDGAFLPEEWAGAFLHNGEIRVINDSI